MTDPVGWGVLGAGRISTVAVGPALAASPRCRVAAIGAREVSRAAVLAATLDGPGTVGGARAYGSYEQVIADPDVEVIYIALPNDAHVPWALEALHAGKHVLCEKPLGLDSLEVMAAFDAAESADRLLVEASWNRWHPRTREAERLVAEGAIGSVVSVDAGFVFDGVPAGDYRMQPSRGGGALYDVGCYALSAVGWASGWGPVSGAEPDVRLHPGGVDLFTSGRLCVGDVAATVRAGIDEPPRQWLQITGTEGAMRLAGDAFTAWTDAPARLESSGRSGQVDSRSFPPCDPYRLMVDAVADRVRGGGSWVVPRRDSEWVAAAIDALRGAGSARG